MNSLRHALENRAVSFDHVSDYESVTTGRAMSLCLHAVGGDVWVLPWSELVCAWYDSTEEREKIILTFLHREVAVFGQNLDPIMADIGTLSLRCLYERGGAHEGRSETGLTCVAKIVISRRR